MSVERFIDYFIPEHFDLFLDICRRDKTFTGKVSIQGEACQQRLLFHQKNLTISSVRVGEQAVAFEMDVEKEAVSFESPVVGQVLVQMEFSGTITDNMTGSTRLITRLMVRLKKLFQPSLRVILRVKPSHV